MSKLKVLATVAALAGVALTGPATAQSRGGGYGGGVAPSKWGSLYLSPTTRAYGFSFKQRSNEEAQQTAYNGCAENADDCIEAVTFQNACGAVAMSRAGGWGSAQRPTGPLAQEAAIASCARRRGNVGCSVVRWPCS